VAQVALVVTPTFGAFLLMSELTLFDAKRTPTKYGIGPDGNRGTLVIIDCHRNAHDTGQ